LNLRTTSVSPSGRRSPGAVNLMGKRTVKFEQMSTIDKNTRNTFHLPIFVCTKPTEDSEKKPEPKKKSSSSMGLKSKPIARAATSEDAIGKKESYLKKSSSKAAASPILNSNSESTDKDDVNKGKVSRLLGQFEERRNKSASPISMATVATPVRNSAREKQNLNETTAQKQNANKTTTEIGDSMLPSTSRTVVGELERKTHEEECMKVAKRRQKKETAMEKTVGDDLTEHRSTKTAQNEVVVSLQKRTMTSDLSSSSSRKNVVVDDSVKATFRARITEMEHMAGTKSAERDMDRSVKLTLERSKAINGVPMTNGHLTLGEREKHRLKEDAEDGLVEWQKQRLRNMQAKEGGQCEEVVTNSVQRIVIKRVKKKTKKKTQSIDVENVTRFKTEHRKMGEGPPAKNAGELYSKTVAVTRFGVPSKERWQQQDEDVNSTLSMEWNVGQDVFDFSLLRKKLQNRIMGMKDEDDLATEEDNRQKSEMRVKLASNLNAKHAMKKWISMDKEQQQEQQGRGMIVK